MKETFDRIFRENIWGNPDSRSGDGGGLSQTTTLRSEIPEILSLLKISTFLDLPCGDFNWMKLVEMNSNYIGADIVPQLINENEQKYESPRRKFIVLDVTREVVPTVDLILCRDLLVHFSFEDICSAYANIIRSASTYVLFTTFPSRFENTDIKTGEWRPLNLSIAPFNFPSPIRIINENCTEWNGHWSDKSLGLWKLDELPKHFGL
jgi:hypothetical protein